MCCRRRRTRSPKLLKGSGKARRRLAPIVTDGSSDRSHTSQQRPPANQLFNLWRRPETGSGVMRTVNPCCGLTFTWRDWFCSHGDKFWLLDSSQAGCSPRTALEEKHKLLNYKWTDFNSEHNSNGGDECDPCPFFFLSAGAMDLMFWSILTSCCF